MTVLSSLQRWQKAIIQAGLTQHVTGDRASLHRAVQVTLTRLVILRILECWGIEPDGQLHHLAHCPDAPARLYTYLQETGDRYQLPLLHSALPSDDAQSTSPFFGITLQAKALSALVLELYTEAWTLALISNPAAVLNHIYALPTEIDPKAPHAQPYRKSYGAYYTPPDVGHSMVDLALHTHRQHHGAIAPPLRILDPACGFGVFLIAAYEWLTLTSPASPPLREIDDCFNDPAFDALYGVDLDPQAVDVTRLLLVLTVLKHRALPPDLCRAIAPALFAQLASRIRWGNAIIAPDILASSPGLSDWHQIQLCPFDWHQQFPAALEAGGFDLVIGNPPYLDSEWMSRYMPAERQYCATHYQSAVGNWDIFCVFIEQAFQLCKTGGFTSLIVPNKLKSADYAANTRRILAIANTLLHLRDYSQVPLFPVAVYPIVYLAQKQVPTHPRPVQYDQMAKADGSIAVEDGSITVKTSHTIPYDRFIQPQGFTWYTSNPSLSRLIDRIESQSTPLEAIASVWGAATVAEAYDIQPLLQDNAHLDPQSAIRMVNSGTIDRYTTLWGRKPLRYLKQTYLHPVIPRQQQLLLPKVRQQQATQPKLIVASMTKVLECVVDSDGVFLAGKSTCIVQSAIALPYLLAILNSRLMSVYYAVVFGGNRLQGGYLRVGAAQLRSLPIALATPDFNSPFIQQAMTWVDQLIAAKLEPSHPTQQIQQLDRAIDQWVYQLYGLSAPEIETLELSPTNV